MPPTREAILGQFQRVVGELDPEIGANARWAEEPVDYFLHAFRPDGAKLPALFEGIPNSKDVLERLQTVFAHAGPETGHMYFMVSRPLPMTDAVLVKKLQRWAASITAMIDVAGLFDDTDTPMIHRLVSNAPVEIVAGPPGEGSSHPLLAMIYEAIIEYKDSVEYPLWAELLIEPTYMIACRYDLVHWILRPALGAVGKNDDLFAPPAELWLAGVQFAFVGEGADIRIHAWRTLRGQPVSAKREAPDIARPRSGSDRRRAKPAGTPNGNGRKR